MRKINELQIVALLFTNRNNLDYFKNISLDVCCIYRNKLCQKRTLTKTRTLVANPYEDVDAEEEEYGDRTDYR